MKRTTLIVGAFAAFAACTPTGPRTDQILSDENAEVVRSEAQLNYSVIDMDVEKAIKATSLKRTSEDVRFVPKGPVPAVVLGVGDEVQISVSTYNSQGSYDVTSNSVNQISSVTLPPQEIGPSGMVSVPPIGRVRAAGNSVQALERILTNKLSEELLPPEATVRLVERRSARVNLVGAVATPGTYSINQNTRHLVEVIAQAGGATGRAENTQVVMSRGGHTGRASLKEVYENPNLNVHLRAGDVIRFEPFEGNFTALGAGGRNADLTFDDVGTNLINALGQAGGVLRDRGSARGVFVYRLMSKDAAAQLGVDLDRITTNLVPVVFRFDMRQPESPFIAGEFEIADGDVLYISSTVISDINGALNAFRVFVPAPRDFVSNSIDN